MPWDSVEEAEKKVPGIKNYSAKGKRAWLSTFNSCYADKGDSKSCYAIAHASARKADGKKASDDIARSLLEVAKELLR
jgi:hypothetical protein